MTHSSRLTLYFLRHGQTALSRENMFCGAGSDPGLTTDGEEMARDFARAYTGFPWKAIYHSNLQRARLTIAPLAGNVPCEIHQRSELREIEFGQWEGKGIPEVDKNYHDDYVRWSADPAWNAPTGGETAIAIARRARPLIEEIRAMYSEGNVLLVSHKATIRIIISDLLGIDLSRFRDRLSCPVASISIVEFGNRGPLLKQLADRSHLSQRLRELPGT